MADYVKNPIANCTVDPRTCRYHNKYFKRDTRLDAYPRLKDISQLYEKLGEPKPSHTLAQVKEEIDVMDFMTEADESAAKSSQDSCYVIHRYTDEYGSKEISYILRHPEKKDNSFYDDKLRDIEEIDKYIEVGTPKREPRTIYRGVDELKHELAGVSKGQTITVPTYMSSSSSLLIAKRFTKKAHPIMLAIKTDKGVAITGASGSEREYLLPRGMSFIVSDIRENVAIVDAGGKVMSGATVIELIESESIQN